MRFRPCIDIHDGCVKQIIGGSLRDGSGGLEENYTSKLDAAHYAELYKKYGLMGGHVILLNKKGSEEYRMDVEQASKALRAYPGGLQIGGGVTVGNAKSFLKMGASHVIVTSYIFFDGKLDLGRLSKMNRQIGRDKLVIDLSCREREGEYYVVTDRWQKYTCIKINEENLAKMAEYCDEFLIHAVDVEGKMGGVDDALVALLAQWEGRPITYAGGISGYQDLDVMERVGRGRLDFTIGSGLDLFGGELPFDVVARRYRV